MSEKTSTQAENAAEAAHRAELKRQAQAFDERPTGQPVMSATGQPLGADVHFEVQQFYHREADLLDEGRFADWLELFTDDTRYWAPVMTNRLRRQQSLAVAGPGETAYYDETKGSLAWRIRRFDSGMAWAEDPPSRTRHLVTNVMVTAPDPEDPSHTGGDLVAESNFLLWRTRLQLETGILAGKRYDLLRRGEEDRLQIARRTILLDINVLDQKNISTFF